MIRRFSISLVLVLLEFSSVMAADDIVLRSSAVPEKAWLGQRVILRIDVLGRDGWTQITSFEDIKIPGAYIMRTHSQGTRLQETIDGASYSGQRYELSIYPQAAGTIKVPPISVEVSTKGQGADANVRQARTPAVTILSDIPAGAEKVRGLISSTQLTAEQNWRLLDETPQVGDVVERTVNLQAVDISGMAFTPLHHEAIPGVGIYPAQPTVQDSSNRGSLTGSRTEVVTYVFEQAGEVQIPDIEFSWWNLVDNRLEHVTLAGRLMHVIAGPGGLTDAGKLPAPQQKRRYLVPMAIMLLSLVYLVYFFRKPLLKRWTGWWVARKESEKSYFQLVLKSIRTKQSAAILRNIMRWLDRINATNDPARLDVFINRHADTRAQKVVYQFLHGVAANEQSTDLTQLQDVLSAARRNWLQSQKPKQGGVDVLPTLNPEQ
ncbi:MAG: protein BatD [Gammaproteobacteria bacterium]|nr:protein BatD [Gammaproteobacteria bacterium]